MRYYLPFLVLLIAFSALVEGDTATTQASIGNALPVASSVQIAAGNLVGGEVSLTANQTTQINITATVTDDNGCSEVTAVNATFFRTNLTNGSAADNDNRSHYSIVCSVESGTCNGVGDLAATYNCDVNVTWYADATDASSALAATNWTVNVTPYDTTGQGTFATNIYDMRTLTAFSLLQTSINFGSLALGANTTTTNQNISVQNQGNDPIDVSLTGYGAVSGDNNSMNCTTGNITIGLLEYSASAFTYGAGVDLSNSSTELDFDLNRGNESTTRPEKSLFFGFAIPSSGVAGTCTGNVVIVSNSDPNLD